MIISHRKRSSDCFRRYNSWIHNIQHENQIVVKYILKVAVIAQCVFSSLYVWTSTLNCTRNLLSASWRAMFHCTVSQIFKSVHLWPQPESQLSVIRCLLCCTCNHTHNNDVTVYWHNLEYTSTSLHQSEKLNHWKSDKTRFSGEKKQEACIWRIY